MRINVTYGVRHLLLKIPAYVVVPSDPDERMRMLLNESYFSGPGSEPMPDEETRLEILANIALHFKAVKFLRDDLLPLLSEDLREQVARKVAALERKR